MTFLLAMAVLAASEPYRLETERLPGAESCPDTEQVSRAVSERLGRDAFTAEATRTAVVRWKRVSGGFVADLQVIEPSGKPVGSRRLTSSGAACAELLASTALTLALIVDPLAVSRPPPEPTPPLTEPPPPPPPHVAEPQPPQPPPPAVVPPPLLQTPRPRPPPSEHAGWLGLGLSGAFFETPGAISGALQLAAAWRYQLLALGAEARLVAPRTIGFREGTVSALSVTGGPFVCLQGERLGGCLLTHFGVLHAWASDYAGIENTASLPSVAIGLRPHVDFAPAASVRLRLFAAVMAHPTVSVLMVGDREAYRSGVVSAELGLSVWFEVARSDDGP